MDTPSVGRSGQPLPEPMTEIPEDDCWRLLRMHDLGRVAVVIDGRPDIFPVNYVAGEGAVVFRTAPGAKLAHAPMTQACFEIDGWDSRTGSGWSVMVHGVISEVTDAVDERAERLRSLPVQPFAPGERRYWLALYADQVTGRRFTSGPLAPPAS